MRLNTISKKLIFFFILISLCYISISSLIAFNVFSAYSSRFNRRELLRWAVEFERIVEQDFIYFNYNNLTTHAAVILNDRPKDFIILYNSDRKEFHAAGAEEMRRAVRSDPLPVQTDIRWLKIDSSPYFLIRIPVQTDQSPTSGGGWCSVIRWKNPTA